MKQLYTSVLIALSLFSFAFAEVPADCASRFRQIEADYESEQRAAQFKYEQVLTKTNQWFKDAKRNAPSVKAMYRMRAKHDEAIAALNKALRLELDRIDRKHDNALGAWEADCNQPEAAREKITLDVVIENPSKPKLITTPIPRRPKKKKKTNKRSKTRTKAAEKPDAKPAPDRASKRRNKKAERYDEQVGALMLEAEKHLKTRYVYGGNTPKQGFDCSGYMKYIYKKQGVELPRVSRDQAKSGKKVKRNDVQPGDLVYFGKSKGKISHIGMVVSEPGKPLKMIHASSSKGVEITDVEGSKYWEKRLQGFRRVLD